MAEPRRVPLLQVKTSFSNGKAPSVGEKEKSNKKDDKESSTDQPTVRLEISLKDSTEKTCPEYSYVKLIKDLVKSDAKLDEGGSQDPFNDDDDDDQLKALAKKFEDKYNPKLSDKGRKRKHDSNPYYHDIGYGYDESDPFVDNTEAYDELVPADWTTQHGGFYINQGELHYRPMADNDMKDFKSPKKRRMIENKKAKTKDGEKSASKTPKELSTQKRKKQLLNKEKKQKKLESALFGEKEKKRKKKIIIEDSEDSPVPLARQIKKDPSLHSQTATSFSSKSLSNGITQSSKNPSATESVVKSPKHDMKSVSVKLESASVLLEKSDNQKTNLNNGTMQAKGQFLKDMQASVEMKKSTGSPGKAADSSKVADESSVTPKGSIKEAEVPSSPPQLPENLPLILEAGVQSLKDAAANCSNGKCRFFDVSVNKTLLGVARTLSKLPCKVRTTVYDHLAFYLPCTKDTLVKRAKTLLIEDQVNQMDAPMKKLKDAIEKEMPHQKKQYDAEVANALTEQVREQMKQSGFPSTNDSSLGKPATTFDEKEGQSTSDAAMTPTEDKSKKNMPKRKFNWTEEIRRLLCDVVAVKVQLYKMSKSRSMTAEEYVKDFLENDVRKLWSKGWMTSRILFKESKSAHQDITQPTSKVKKVTKKPELSTSLPLGNSSANSHPEQAKLKSNLSLSNLLQARHHSLSSLDIKGKLTSVSQTLKTSTVSTKPVNIAKSGVIKKDTDKSQQKKLASVKTISDSKTQKLNDDSKLIKQELQSALSTKVSLGPKNTLQISMDKDTQIKNVVISNPFEPSNQPMKSPNEVAIPVKLNRKPNASKTPNSSEQFLPNFDGIQSILDYAALTEGVKRITTQGQTADQSYFRHQLSQEATKPKSTAKTSISPKHQAPLVPPAMSSSHFGVWSTKSPIMSSFSTVHSSAASQHQSKHVSPPKPAFDEIASHMRSPSKPTGTQSSSRSSFKTPPSESHRSISATPPKSSPQSASPHSTGSAGSTRTSPLLHFPPNLDPKRRLSGHSPEDKRAPHSGISHSISRLTRDPSPQHSSFSSLPYSSAITSFASSLPAQVAPQAHDQLLKMTSQQHSLPNPSPLDIMFRQQQQQQLQLHMKQRQSALQQQQQQQQQQLLKQHSQQQQQHQQQQLSSALGTQGPVVVPGSFSIPGLSPDLNFACLNPLDTFGSTMSTSEHYPSPYTNYRSQYS